MASAAPAIRWSVWFSFRFSAHVSNGNNQLLKMKGTLWDLSTFFPANSFVSHAHAGSLLYPVAMPTRGDGTEDSRTGMFANETSSNHASPEPPCQPLSWLPIGSNRIRSVCLSVLSCNNWTRLTGCCSAHVCLCTTVDYAAWACAPRVWCRMGHKHRHAQICSRMRFTTEYEEPPVSNTATVTVLLVFSTVPHRSVPAWSQKSML